jgi:hypothetical protein
VLPAESVRFGHLVIRRADQILMPRDWLAVLGNQRRL